MNIELIIFMIGGTMKTGPKGFTDGEKQALRSSLVEACIQSWIDKGYTKTSIAALTSSANIATGSFYLLFENKEELFYESFLSIQNDLSERAHDITHRQPTLEGFIALNMMLYHEYDSKPFLYTFNDHDFKLFLKKLDPLQVNRLFESNYSSFEDALETCGLTSIISDTFTFDTLNTLLSTLRSGHETTTNKADIYELMLRATLPHITKEKK